MAPPKEKYDSVKEFEDELVQLESEQKDLEKRYKKAEVIGRELATKAISRMMGKFFENDIPVNVDFKKIETTKHFCVNFSFSESDVLNSKDFQDTMAELRVLQRTGFFKIGKV